MTESVVNTALLLLIGLVLVWIGFMVMALNWLASHWKGVATAVLLVFLFLIVVDATR